MKVCGLFYNLSFSYGKTRIYYKGWFSFHGNASTDNHLLHHTVVIATCPYQLKLSSYGEVVNKIVKRIGKMQPSRLWATVCLPSLAKLFLKNQCVGLSKIYIKEQTFALAKVLFVKAKSTRLYPFIQTAARNPFQEEDCLDSN